MLIKFMVEHARFEINLEEVCKDYFNKYEYYDPKTKKTKVEKEHVFYSVSKAKKLFRLMIQNINSDEMLDDIEAYLKEHNQKLYEVFRKERK